VTSPPLDRPASVRPTVLVAAGAAVAFLALTVAVLAPLRPLLSLDVAVSQAALHTALAHPLWRSAMAAVTMTGSTVVLGPVAALGCVTLLWRRRLRAACFVALTLPVTLVIRLLLVNAIHRARPVDRLAPASGWSFPSGHTTASAATALIAGLVCWSLVRRRSSRVVVAALLAGWAVAVGISRVALVVHWPSDVGGAWLLVLTIVPPAALLLRTTVPAAVPTG
jgi:membrane-associated phospholipid phosphatase